MIEISELETADRIEIFKHIALDESEEIRDDILDAIASNHYHTFLNFCNSVFAEKTRIKSVYCTLKDDNLSLNIEYFD